MQKGSTAVQLTVSQVKSYGNQANSTCEQMPVLPPGAPAQIHLQGTHGSHAASPPSARSATASRQGSRGAHPMKARLHCQGDDRYSVILDGKLLVERSRDPECDAARALLALGHTGKLMLCDGKNGIPRTIIGIEKAAGLRVKEGPLRFAPYESCPDRAYSPESDAGDQPVPEAPDAPPHNARPSRISA
jgi:hypothetical protein